MSHLYEAQIRSTLGGNYFRSADLLISLMMMEYMYIRFEYIIKMFRSLFGRQYLNYCQPTVKLPIVKSCIYPSIQN